MRILYKNLAGHGGAMASVAMLLKAIARQFSEDHIIIICTRGSGLEDLVEIHNVEVLTISAGIGKEATRCYLDTFGISRVAHQYDVDVIWSANIGPYIRTGFPQVLSVTNPYQFYPWRYSRYHPGSTARVASLRWLFRRSLRHADAVLVQTPFTGDCVRAIRGAPQLVKSISKAVESPEDVIRRPLSTEQAQCLDNGLGRKAFTFLFVSTAIPHKNHRTVIEAMERLRSKGVNARLVLTTTEKQLRPYCNRQLLDNLVESGHVILIGWIGKDRLAAMYEACDACVMPSVLEALSSAHLEAMLWNKVQVCADLPYARDLCGNAAVFAAPENATDWAEKMEMVVRDAELRNALITAGCERAARFPRSWQEVALETRTFLADVVNKSKA